MPLLFFQLAVFSQRFTLEERDASLDRAVQDVARSMGYLYLVVYREHALEGVRVSFSVRDATLEEAMDSCLGNLPFYYRVIGRSLNVYPGSCVWGRVIDEQGRGIAGATVQATGPGLATSSDEQGRFRLRLPGGERSVVISCVGYSPCRLRVTGSRQLLVSLEVRTRELGQVVISTGFDELPAGRMPGSFTKLDRELIERRPAASLIERMDGVTPSLLVNTNVIAGTNQSAMTIRGRSTIFSNPNPLVVVDDFPYSGDLNNINPEDIASITVLRDAAAASLWGTRAANGVIVIKTLQGRYGQKPRLSFSGSVTVGQKPDLYYKPILSSPDFVDVEEYLFARGFYNATIASGNHPALSPVVDILQQQRQGLLSNTDTARLLGRLRGQDSRRDLNRYWYRPLVNQAYWLGYSGGTATNRYSLSAGLDRDLTALTRNAYDRITLTGNHSYQLIPRTLELNTSLAFTASTTSLNNTGNSNANYPYLKLADTAGHALAVPYQLRLGYVDTVGGGRLLDWHYRPLDELHNADNVIRLTDWRLNVGLRYTILRNLEAHALYQYGQGLSDQQNLQSVLTYYTRNEINEFTQPGPGGQLGHPVPVGDILDETRMNYQSHNGRLQLDYRPWLGSDQELHLLAGSELQDVEGRTNLARTYGFSAASQSGLPVSSYTTAYYQYSSPGQSITIPYSNNNSVTADHYRSYYGNGSYQYKQRYTVSASGRIDQSNLFGVNINHKTLPLWSAGAAWEVSREDFYPQGWLSLLRLRATDGYNGNVYKAVAAFTSAAAFISSMAVIEPGYINTYGAPAAAITNPPNPGLRWEEVQVIDAGLDFGSRDSLVQGSLDYYSKSGRYLIGATGLDPTSGNIQYTANVANMVTRGIDLDLHTRLHFGKVEWNSVALFSYVRDKVTRYLIQPPTILTFLNPQWMNPLPGHPLYSVYALRWAGLDPQTGNPQGWLEGHPSQNYTAIINSTDYHTLVYEGPVNPPFFGSWRNGITWKGWGFSANIVYKFGHYFARPSIQYFALFYGTSQGHPDYDGRWQHPGDERHTTVPSMVYPASSTRDSYYASSTVVIEKGDLIRLQDMQVYYDFTRKNLARLPVQTLRLYAYAGNVGLLWTANRRHIDPDALNSLPSPRIIAFGLKMQL